MNTSERGNVHLGALVIGGLCVLILCGYFYKYRNDMRRYLNGPQAIAKVRVPQRRVSGYRIPMPTATPRVPNYTILGELQDRPVIYREFPDYPEWAEEEGVEGRVKLAFRVN